MSGFDNDCLYMDNGIDTREEGAQPVENQMVIDGQLLIAASSGQKIRVGSLTSNDASVTLTYSEPSSTSNAIDLSAGTSIATTYTTNDGSGTPVDNILNVLGIEETTTRASGNTVSIFSPRISRWVVDPTLDRGTHQTITAALAAASTGDTIFVRPGTYIENITLVPGISICGMPGTEGIAKTILNGKITQTATGTASVSHLRIVGNGDVCLDIGGSGTIQTLFQNCWFFFSDADCFTCNNANASPNFRECNFNQLADTLDMYNITACNDIQFLNCNYFNSSSLPGTSNISAGLVRFIYTRIMNQKFTSSSTANIQGRYSQFITYEQNVTPITTAGTGANHEFEMCYFRTGSATAIVCGAGTTVVLDNISINSTNTTQITETGTVYYYANMYQNTASFTPALSGSSGAPTVGYTSQLGKYTRIGNRVDIKVFLDLSSRSGGSGDAIITGLPFTSSNDGISQICPIKLTGVGWDVNAYYLVGQLDANASQISISEINPNAAAGTVAIGDFASGDTLYLTMTYWV